LFCKKADRIRVEHNYSKRFDSDHKWKFLQHRGPRFPPPYRRLPDTVKFLYDGIGCDLSEESEEAATLYAKALRNDCVKFSYDDSLEYDVGGDAKAMRNDRVTLSYDDSLKYDLIEDAKVMRNDCVKFSYDNSLEYDLAEDSEESATFYAKEMRHERVNKDRFRENFFESWRQIMSESERQRIREFGKCDFREIRNFFSEVSHLVR
jgi:hypothetical protein